MVKTGFAPDRRTVHVIAYRFAVELAFYINSAA
jgi:hypothetical protein